MKRLLLVSIAALSIAGTAFADGAAMQPQAGPTVEQLSAYVQVLAASRNDLEGRVASLMAENAGLRKQLDAAVQAARPVETPKK